MSVIVLVWEVTFNSLAWAYILNYVAWVMYQGRLVRMIRKDKWPQPDKIARFARNAVIVNRIYKEGLYWFWRLWVVDAGMGIIEIFVQGDPWWWVLVSLFNAWMWKGIADREDDGRWQDRFKRLKKKVKDLAGAAKKKLTVRLPQPIPAGV